MDPKRFDTWTRNRALRFSRRDALRLAGASAAAAALPLKAPSIAAQNDCSWTLHAETAGGPSVPTVYDGTLKFAVGPNGELDGATFTPTGGAPVPVTGIATGRSVDFQVALSSSQTLVLTGAADQPVTICQGAAGGILSGPQPGDLGVWLASPGALGTGSASAQTGSSSSSSSTAECSPGQIACGGSCIAACQSGQAVDQQSCACVSSQSTCLPDLSPCDGGAECCSLFCSNGACASCPGLVCGDMGCVDNTSDPNNCGTCGTVCVDDTGFCLGGVCQCIPDNEPKGSSSSSCCSQSYVEPTGLCGCALLGEWCGSTGECCDNGSGEICVDDGSGFKACCRSSGNVCASDAECCFSSPSYSPQYACVSGACAQKP